MKKFLIIVALLALVGCAMGWFVTYRILDTTQSTLQQTQELLDSIQTQLNDTSDSLEETQKSLEETRQGLEEQKSQTENYIQLYTSNLEELQDREEELDAVTGELDAMTGELALSQQINREFQETIDEMKSKLDIYIDTLGTQVFSSVLPPYNTGYLSDLALINENTAENPTWEQLVNFLREDKTDKNLYVPDVYMCGSFAQDLHNNAEASGIRAAFVVVHYYDAEPHALNAFKTIDKGLVYIDVTGGQYPIYLTSLDKKVELEKDKPYRTYLIFAERGWGMNQGGKRVKSIEIYW